MDHLIDYWKNQLGIKKWSVSVSPIDPDQHSVDYDNEEYFIGISACHRKKSAVIYHDIPLDEESIIHELLHIRYPESSFPDKSYEEYEQVIDRAAKTLVKERSYKKRPKIFSWGNSRDMTLDL